MSTRIVQTTRIVLAYPDDHPFYPYHYADIDGPSGYGPYAVSDVLRAYDFEMEDSAKAYITAFPRDEFQIMVVNVIAEVSTVSVEDPENPVQKPATTRKQTGRR